METARSLRTRAVMALALMVGFYVLALTIAAALLSVPYLEFAYLERANGRLTIFCLIGGITILWAIVPRIDKFQAPGPALTPSNAPQLFTMINGIAQTTSQPRPEHVYLLNDVNAFVSHRGGFMGFGSKRVMGVGLPLIQGLSAAQLRSVMAHEFGHYVSGDVALGPWIHKTRSAIGRTLTELAKRNSVLVYVFNWYARMFMRMTMLISREQEFVADATAARVAGVASTISALKRVELIAPAYGMYLQNELLPVLRAGFLPPISEGFDQYLNASDTMEMCQRYAAEDALGAEAGEFDSHPRMAERVKALERLTPPRKLDEVESTETAVESTPVVLKNPDRHARALLEYNLGRDQVTKLKTIDWTEVGDKVYARFWEQQVKEHAKWLSTLTANQIPSDKKWFEKNGNLITNHIPEAPAEFRIAFAAHVVSSAIGVALLRQGWTMATTPGQPIVLVKGDHRFTPRESVMKLADASLPTEEWLATCREIGLEALPLATAPN